ncbi:MAG: GNAT family N-acetyltransferase, partial [Ktedonobacterales bacterium]
PFAMVRIPFTDGPTTELTRLEHEHAAAAAHLGVAMLERANLLDARVPSMGIAHASGARRTLSHLWERRLCDPRYMALGMWRHGRLIGTLAVTYRHYPPESEELLWSPRSGGWMPQALCAIAPDQRYADVLPPLYEAASAWLGRRDVPLHFASILAADREALNVWLSLGFRQQGIFALLDEAAHNTITARKAVNGIRVRRAKHADAGAIARLLAESHRYHALLPGSFYTPADGDRHYATVVQRELASPDGPHYIVVEEQGKVIGCASSVLRDAQLAEPARYMQPMPLGYIDEVAVTQQARGRGIGTALVAQLLSEFEARGVRHFGIHFLVNNPLATHAWLHLGFRPLEIRLQRTSNSSHMAVPEELSL